MKYTTKEIGLIKIYVLSVVISLGLTGCPRLKNVRSTREIMQSIVVVVVVVVCVRACVRACVHVCVCVCVREREGTRTRKRYFPRIVV